MCVEPIRPVRFREADSVATNYSEIVASIFARSRLLLVPSQYEETLARVAVGAFANRIPVMGSNCNAG